MSSYEREYRRALAIHMYRMHGYSSTQGERLTIRQMEFLHDSMHMDGYMCPPHTHKEVVDERQLGEVKLTLGKTYVKELLKTYKEIHGEEQ